MFAGGDHVERVRTLGDELPVGDRCCVAVEAERFMAGGCRPLGDVEPVQVHWQPKPRAGDP